MGGCITVTAKICAAFPQIMETLFSYLQNAAYTMICWWICLTNCKLWHGFVLCSWVYHLPPSAFKQNRALEIITYSWFNIMWLDSLQLALLFQAGEFDKLHKTWTSAENISQNTIPGLTGRVTGGHRQRMLKLTLLHFIWILGGKTLFNLHLSCEYDANIRV